MTKRLPFRVALIWLALAGLGYVLLLGEAGLFHRKDLQSRLALMQQEIEELKTENRLLRENYYLLRQGNTENREQQDQKAIILKFDKEEPRSEPETELHLSSLDQARALYGFGAFFGCLVAVALAIAWERKRTTTSAGTDEIRLPPESDSANKNENRS